MKKLIIIAILLFASTSFAWELRWDAVTGATGYRVSYRPVTSTVPGLEDVGNVTKWTIPTTLTPGTRYEFWVQAYVGTTNKSYSGDSDHIRWTYPLPVQTIELPAAPQRLVIEFGQ
jgi:hypothetical protein